VFKAIARTKVEHVRHESQEEPEDCGRSLEGRHARAPLRLSLSEVVLSGARCELDGEQQYHDAVGWDLAITAAGKLLEAGIGEASEETGGGVRARRADRLTVYLTFQRSVLAFVHSAQLVRAMVLGFSGAVWTMPSHQRHLRRYDEAIGRMLTALGDLRIVGSPEPRIIGERVARLLGELAQAPAPRKKGDVPRILGGMQPTLNRIGEQLMLFTEAVRKDLGHDKVRRHRWQLWRPKTVPWPGGWPFEG